MQKSDIRKLFLAKRDALTETEWNDLNNKLALNIIQYIQTLPSNLNVGSFLPMEHKKEISTHLFHSQLEGFPFLHSLCFPRVAENNQMTFYKISSENDLELSQWKIPEPKAIEKHLLSPESLHLLFIPLLAFDINGQRVGYGKGFYDRYLEKCNSNLIKVGLSLFSEPVEIDDLHANDIPLDVIITPYKVIGNR